MENNTLVGLTVEEFLNKVADAITDMEPETEISPEPEIWPKYQYTRLVCRNGLDARVRDKRRRSLDYFLSAPGRFRPGLDPLAVRRSDDFFYKDWDDDDSIRRTALYCHYYRSYCASRLPQ